MFTLDSISRELRLSQQLNREEIDHHSIRIVATNQETMPPIRQVSESSFLYVSIEVEDVNDNPPTFKQHKYSTGVSERDNVGKILIQLEATDLDLDDIVTYFMLTDSMKISDDTLLNVKERAFLVNQNSGALNLNFQVEPSMMGYFEFQVEARDLVNHTDTADVKIFIVAEANQNDFPFYNTSDEVKSVDQLRLAEILTGSYEAECVIDDILPLKDGTESFLRAHFIRNDEAINKEEITEKSSDPNFIINLMATLKRELELNLTGVPQNNQTPDEGSSNILEITLAIVSGVLFVALITVVIFYIIQSKSYNRQIKALSENKFEPTKDADNYFNIKALPNTNIFSEGKQINPVMMQNFEDSNNLDLDTKSIISNDSSDDFANLHDNPIFDINPKMDKNNDSTYA